MIFELAALVIAISSSGSGFLFWRQMKTVESMKNSFETTNKSISTALELLSKSNENVVAALAVPPQEPVKSSRFTGRRMFSL